MMRGGVGVVRVLLGPMIGLGLVCSGCNDNVCPEGTRPVGNRCIFVPRCNAPSLSESAIWETTPTRLDDTEAGVSATFDNVGASADGLGRITVVWRSVIDSVASLKARQYVPDEGWQAITPLDPPPMAAGPSIVGDVSLATSENGTAMVVWNRTENDRVNVYASHFTPEQGFGEAQLIENDDQGNAGPPVVTMNIRGEAYAVWPHFDGTRWAMRANFFEPERSWGVFTTVDEGAAADATSPRLTTRFDGGAFLVWHEQAGAESRLKASEFNPGGNWGSPKQVTIPGVFAGQHQVAFDSSGAGLVLSSNGPTLVLNTYNTGKSSDDGELSPVQSNELMIPSLASSSQGSVVAAWRRVDDTGQRIEAAPVDGFEGWREVTTLTTATSEVSQPAASFGIGKAVATWHVLEGAERRVYAAVYDVNTGWSASQRLRNNAGLSDQDPVSVVDCAGASAIIFTEVVPPMNSLFATLRK